MPARWAQISLVLETSGTGIATETPTGPWGDCREAAAGGLAKIRAQVGSPAKIQTSSGCFPVSRKDRVHHYIPSNLCKLLGMKKLLSFEATRTTPFQKG